MPITTLEIIDTAVKVGLGAAISAIASWFLNSQAAKNKQSETKIDGIRELIKEFSVKTEKIKASIDNMAHAYFQNDIKSALEYSIEGVQEYRSATALANIINNKNILQGLTKVEENMMPMYHELRKDKPSLDELKIYENAIFKIIEDLQPEISASYLSPIT